MTHAPKFWADKLPANLRPIFWSMAANPDHLLCMSGETAYYRTLALAKLDA